MGFEVKNLFSRIFLLKLVELVLQSSIQWPAVLHFISGFHSDRVPPVPGRTEWRHPPLGRGSRGRGQGRGRAGGGHLHLLRLPLHSAGPHGGGGVRRPGEIRGQFSDYEGGVWAQLIFIQMLLFNLCGFLLYIAIGSSQIATYRSERRPLVMVIRLLSLTYWWPRLFQKTHTIYSMGAMAILTSLLFLFDTTLSIMDIFSK